MRDPKRISKIMNLIKTIWKMNPDLRLGQLLDNIIDHENGPELFEIEDNVLFDKLQKKYLKGNDEEIDKKLDEILKGLNGNG